MTFSTKFAAVQRDIAGVSVFDLARQFGTPTYIYDAATIRSRLAELRAFDTIRYAQKACSTLAIVDLMRREGALVDAVSAGEIRRALRVGYEPTGDPPPIVYTADIFDRESLDLVAAHNVHVNCGSPAMIEQYGERMPGRGITLRINPGFGHGHSQKTNTGGEHSKHGIWHEQLGDCVKLAARYDLRISGLHLHIGSGTDFAHLAQLCGAMEEFATTVGPQVESLSTGGGLPVPYRDDDEAIDIAAYYQLWDATRRRLEESLARSLRLEIEPGRYLAAEAGYLICEVRAIKQMGANTFYLVDAGFNTLARPILYGAYHPMALAPLNENGERAMQPVVVGGPLCESGDIFTQRDGGYVETRMLPEACVGDLLVIGCAGAYGQVMASNYNSKPFPAEVLIDDGQTHLIRSRQSFEDLTRNEHLPS